MDRTRFEEDGFLGPSRVLSEAQCRALVAALAAPGPAPVDWPKGWAASHPLFHQVATLPAVLDPVVALLGPHVVLWGASVVVALPGHLHPPHVDIETAAPDAAAVSVWIGLHHAGPDRGMTLVTRSHRLETVQQVAHERGMRRGAFGDAEVLAWARERDPAAELVVPPVGDGDAIWFDGRLWHGSRNTTALTRRALLLQFASAGTPVRIPDLTRLEWPFRLRETPRPPCIVVAGEDRGDRNRLVPPPRPPAEGRLAMTAWSAPLSPVLAAAGGDFTPTVLFDGQTSNARGLTIHVSHLADGVSPHPPHTHPEEELIVFLEGSARLEVEDASGPRRVTAAPGLVVYYPAGRAHTLRAGPGEAARYLVLKWTGWPRPVAARLDTRVADHRGLAPERAGGFGAARLWDGPTDLLRRLEVHLSVLDPGGGYQPHVDAHDVAVVLLEGAVETMGATLEAPAVAFTSGGIPHGLHNVGPAPARYLVVELHGSGPPLPEMPELPAATTTAAVPATPAIPLRRRARVAVWNWGGRVLRRFPRLHRLLRRGLRRLSPWT